MTKKKFFDKSLFSLNTPEGKLNLFLLALPLFLQSISGTLIGVIQSSLVAHYNGGFFVSVLGFSATLNSLFVTIVQMIPLGLSIILSIYLGQERSREEQATLTGTALVAMVVFTTVLGALLCAFAEPLLRLFGMSGEEYAVDLPYTVKMLRYRITAVVAAYWYLPLAHVLNCHGKTAVNLTASLSSSIFSALFTYLILYVFSVPHEFIVMGIGLCSLGANLIHGIIVAVYYAIKRYPFRIAMNWKFLGQIFKLGVPASIANIAYTLSTTVTGTAVAQLGKPSYYAKQFISQATQFVYYFGYGLANAGAIMMGRLYGMGEKEKIDKLFRQNLILVVLINVVLSAIMFAIHRFILQSVYAANEDILKVSFAVFAIDIAVEFGRGANHVGQNSLNALGDVKFTTVISIVSCWAVNVGLSYLFVFAFGWGLWSVWLACVVDEFVRAILYIFRWIKGKWKTKLAVE